MRRVSYAMLAALLGLHAFDQGHAQDLEETLRFDPVTIQLGESDLRITGIASGSSFAADTKAGREDSGVTGLASAQLRLQRIFDTGLVIGARSSLLLASDTLSGDAYGNDTLQQFYLYMQTGLGTVELGQSHGASRAVAFAIPKVSDHVSLDDPDTFFFRDGAGNRFDSFFRFQTATDAAQVNTKLSYISPRLFGVQLGASFTPVAHKAPLPFWGNPQSGPRQDLVWEVAASYSEAFSDVAVGLWTSFAHGKLANGPPGFDNLHDFSAGIQFAYQFPEVKLSAGANYRVSNGYGFNPSLVLRDEDTQLGIASFLVESGRWRTGFEYADGDIDGPGGIADFGSHGTQLSAGYRLNANIQLSAGWQWRDYARNLGAFYTGTNRVEMNAGFLTLDFTL